MRTDRTALALIAVVALSAGFIEEAQAQPTPQTETSAAASEQVIEEIIVTARRRREALQRTPVAVTAFTSLALEERSIDDLGGIAGFTPNLTITPGSIAGNSSAQVYIRGIGQFDFQITKDPGVGIYVDGVYLARAQGSLMDLVDLERVEVLRGPQGTLFGKNTIGGAINIVTAKPTGKFAGRAAVTTGRFDRVDGRLSVDFPIVEERLSGKIAFAARTRDGYGKSVDFNTGTKTGERGDDNSMSWRGLLHWTPAPPIDVLIAVDGSRVREESPVQSLVAFVPPDPADMTSLVNLYNFVAAPSFGLPPFDGRYIPDDPFVSFGDGPSRNDLNVWGMSLTVDWQAGATTVKSITSYRDMEGHTGIDDSVPPVVIGQTDDLDQYQISQEIQIGGLAFENRLNWLVGGIFFTEHAKNHTVAEQFPALNPVFQMFGIPVELGRDDRLKNVTRSYAAFAHGTYSITDRLGFTAGLRYTYETKKFTNDQRTILGTPVTPPGTDKESWNALSPKVGLEFQATDDFMAYASVSRGFRSGGFNARAAGPADLGTFDPEFVWAYEIGFKTRAFDERFQLNVATFYNDYTGIQLLLVNATPAGFNVTTQNAAKATIKGVEIEMIARPVAGFELQGGIGFADSEIKGPPAASGVPDGARLMETPRWSANAGARYAIPLGNSGTLILRGDYVYKSKHFHDVKNTQAIAQNGFGLFNVRVTYESPDSAWQVAVFGTNLADKRYTTTGVEAFMFANFAVAQWGRPREWGVTIERTF